MPSIQVVTEPANEASRQARDLAAAALTRAAGREDGHLTQYSSGTGFMIGLRRIGGFSRQIVDYPT
jgi:hypothetical protein